MPVSYFSSTGRLQFETAPYRPRKPFLMVVADDPFKPDEIIEPAPGAGFLLPTRSGIRIALTILRVMALAAVLGLVFAAIS
ncbi:MAG: hypothetical protein HOM58_23740 [Rhodospirillaceae bacterium]|jgi:hypothetical protein|nr:hypothetical protein [Rhodospirillaceae bacterium]MBT5459362.1 hypothetical protein [Rhodospirillaceae bacterium]